jgi:hypothetical protein
MPENAPAAEDLIGDSASGHAFSPSERQFVVDQRVEDMSPVKERRSIAAVYEVGVGNGASVFLRQAKSVKGM